MKSVASGGCEVSSPIASEPDTIGRGISSDCAKKSPARVLVVDDEPLIRWSIAESLAAFGLHVEEAMDAATALRCVRTASTPFVVVVLDLRLADMADLSLLVALRELLPAARLVLMTAFATPEITTEATELGAIVLNKPFELDDLNRIVLTATQGPN
jgi:two-component system, NtrC family, response regulator AtoC